MKATPAQYAQAWYAAIKEKPKQAKKISDALLRQLQAAGQYSMLPRIVHELERIEDKEQGIVNVHARTANKHSEKEIKELAAKLLKAKDVRLHIEEDPELIGGLVIETESERFDLSVQKQLQNLRARI